MFEEEYNKLNPEQKLAVDHVDGPMLVLAGAGTGKTQIIALRIAKLLQVTQLDPRNILCLTFTETGVSAMRQRLQSIIGTAAYYVKIHTFHSFCNDVIQDHPEQFLFANKLEALSDVERIRVFEQVFDQLPVDSLLKPFAAPYFYIKDAISAIQTLKRENVEPKDYEKLLQQLERDLKKYGPELEGFSAIHGQKLTASDCKVMISKINEMDPTQPMVRDLLGMIAEYESILPEDAKGAKQQRVQFKNAVKKYYQNLVHQLPKQQALAQVYTLYQAHLQQAGLYDYEDMLLFVANQFSAKPDFLAEYQEQYQYILVDEYQDTNGAQNKIVQLLGSYFENPNIFVVGDDRQAIFRFQGASLENILYFKQLYGEHVQLVTLKDNYRSHQTILDASHSMITRNQRAIQQYIPEVQQHLNAALPIPAQQIEVGEFEHSSSEYYWVAKTIQQLIAAGTEPSEIAVLYRNNHDVDDVMDLFTRLAIPFKLESGVDILQDIYVQQFITLLRFTTNFQSSDEDLFYILQFVWFDCVASDVIKITNAAYTTRTKLFDIVNNSDKREALQLEQPEKIQSIMQNIAEWRQASVNTRCIDFVITVLNESGLLHYLLQQTDKVQRLNYIHTLVREVKQLNRSNPNFIIRDFIAHLQALQDNNLSIQQEELQTNQAAVRLMTAHKAKGLEFEHVFIIKCLDKHWGNVPERAKLKLPPGILHFETVPGVDEHNEDERRLFYVALTRAKKSLYITYPKYSAMERQVAPSLFLSELDQQHIKQLDTTATETEALQRLQTICLTLPLVNHTEQERVTLTDMLQHYRLSATHLNDYLNCPRLFYYQDVLHVPQAISRSVAFGIAVHNALRDMSIRYNETKKLFTKKQLFENFTIQLEAQLLPAKQHQESLAFGEKTLNAYYDEYLSSLKQIVFAEHNFSSHDVHIGDVPIIGNVDRIEITDETNKLVHVIDYKTGSPDNKGEKLGPQGDYKRQLLFYKLLCDGSERFPYTMQTGEIRFVQASPKTGQFVNKVYEFSDEEVAGLKDIVQHVYSDIKALKFLDVPESEMCGECKYCELFQIL